MFTWITEKFGVLDASEIQSLSILSYFIEELTDTSSGRLTPKKVSVNMIIA